MTILSKKTTSELKWKAVWKKNLCIEDKKIEIHLNQICPVLLLYNRE